MAQTHDLHTDLSIVMNITALAGADSLKLQIAHTSIWFAIVDYFSSSQTSNFRSCMVEANVRNDCMH